MLCFSAVEAWLTRTTRSLKLIPSKLEKLYRVRKISSGDIKRNLQTVYNLHGEAMAGGGETSFSRVAPTNTARLNDIPITYRDDLRRGWYGRRLNNVRITYRDEMHRRCRGASRCAREIPRVT